MLQYIFRRSLLMIPTLIGVTIVVFLLIHLTPGDPVENLFPGDASQADKDRVREELGLNEPLPVQYSNWIINVLQGDFGRSISRQTEVWGMLSTAFSNTLILALAGAFIAIVLSLVIGTLSAMYPKSFFGTLGNMCAITGVSIPNFWAGLILIGIFSVWLGWLPPSGMSSLNPENAFTDFLKHLLLPAITVSLTTLGVMTRIVRSTVYDLLQQDFITTLRAKGQGKVGIMKHLLKNALPPILTVAGLEFGALLGGSAITETIFAWPGIGRMIFESISQRDFPVIQGAILLVAFLFVFINLVVDVIHAYVDPRVQKSEQGVK